jgi:hypothetical protein
MTLDLLYKEICLGMHGICAVEELGKTLTSEGHRDPANFLPGST